MIRFKQIALISPLESGVTADRPIKLAEISDPVYAQLLGKSWKLRSSGDFSTALIYANKAVKRDPSQVAGYIARANINFLLGKYIHVIRDCREILTHRNLDIKKRQTTYYMAGRAYFEQGKFDLALPMLEQAEATQPSSTTSEILYYLGVTYTMFRQWERANSCYLKAFELEPKTLALYCARAGVFFNLGNYTQALELLNTLLELEPNHIQGRVNRSIIYLVLNNLEQALSDSDYALGLGIEVENLYNNRGAIFNKLGNHLQAIDCFTKELKINPKLAQTWFNRGIVYKEMDSYDEAIADFSRAIELKPRYSEALSNRAIIYIHKGCNHEALQDLQNLIALDCCNEGVLSAIKIVSQSIDFQDIPQEICSKVISIYSIDGKVPQDDQELSAYLKQSNFSSYDFLSFWQTMCKIIYQTGLDFLPKNQTLELTAEMLNLDQSGIEDLLLRLYEESQTPAVDEYRPWDEQGSTQEGNHISSQTDQFTENGALIVRFPIKSRISLAKILQQYPNRSLRFVDSRLSNVLNKIDLEIDEKIIKRCLDVSSSEFLTLHYFLSGSILTCVKDKGEENLWHIRPGGVSRGRSGKHRLFGNFNGSVFTVKDIVDHE